MPRTASAIQTELDTWYVARAKVASGQSYTVDGQSVTRANLAEINKTIAALRAELGAAQATANGRRPGVNFQGTKLGGMGY